MSVTFQKLASRVQANIENDPDIPRLTQRQLMQLLGHTFGHIGDALSNGEDVYLEGFGRFYPDCKPPRKVRSGFTDEVHVTDYKVFVRFSPFKHLNLRVQEYLGKLGLTKEDLDAR